MLVQYIDAPAGAGKTTAIEDIVRSKGRTGALVVVAQPSIKLCEQTVFSMNEKVPKLSSEIINSKNSYNVTNDIMDYLAFRGSQPPLIVTHEGLERVTFIEHRNEIHLIIDEPPQAHDLFDEVLPTHHRVITDHIEAIPSSVSGYSLLGVGIRLR